MRNRIKPLSWQILSLGVSVALFTLILVNRAPNFLRPVSMSLRTGFGLVIPLTALALYLAFRIPNRVGDLIGMAAALSLFAMPLAGLWASGQSQSVVISGLIPLTDAANYYNDSLRILVGRSISLFSAMRPFFAGFLSFVMLLTGRNLMTSLAVITALAGFAIYFTAREVQRTHGAETAVLLFIILFLYFRHHAGTSMSETLGVPLGAIGMGLIWRGIRKQSQTLAVFGLLMSSLALNTRPGAMFVLPLILLWLGWIFGGENRGKLAKFLLGGTAAIVLGFALNSLLIRLLADPSGTAFSNFSWAFYGLASGGTSYTYIFEQHPEVFLLPNPEQTRAIYRLAFELILQSPELLIRGAFHNWAMFFSNSWYSAYSFMEGENALVFTVTRWTIYALCVLGFVKWALKPGDPYSGLVVMASLGVLLSVPFVPPTDAYRVRLYAASIVIFGLLPGMGLSLITSRLNLRFLSPPAVEIPESKSMEFFAALFIFMILGGALAARGFSQPAPSFEFSCSDGRDKLMLRLDAGSSVNVMREKSLFLDWMPNFHQGLFTRSIHSLADVNLIRYLEGLPAGTTIFSSVDYLSNRQALIVAPTDRLPLPGTYIGLCGEWETDPELQKSGVFFADDIIAMPE